LKMQQISRWRLLKYSPEVIWAKMILKGLKMTLDGNDVLMGQQCNFPAKAEVGINELSTA